MFVCVCTVICIILIIQGRYNVVLLGDALSDTKMTAGLERVDHVIKIGFLNSNVSTFSSCIQLLCIYMRW